LNAIGLVLELPELSLENNGPITVFCFIARLPVAGTCQYPHGHGDTNANK
jgi:hypothetical protein